MSAYTMHDDEINTIISYFVDPSHARGDGAWLKIGDRYDYLSRGNAAEVAGILMAQNVRSVNGRYAEDTASAYAFNYLPEARKRPVGNVIGALDCYEYQASETSDWEATSAYAIVQGLRKYLLKMIADKDGTYTWGIE